MTRRRFLACLLLVPFAVLCTGCTLRPDHLTVYAEANEAENASNRKTRTVGGKVGASATYDLSRR